VERDRLDELARERRRTGLRIRELAWLLLRSPRLLVDLIRAGLRGAVTGVRNDPALPSLLHAQHVRTVAPDAALGAGWHGHEDFLALLDEQLDRESEVLEVGCGGGRVSRLVAPKVRRLVCTDVSPKILAEAKRALGSLDNVELRRADALTLEGIPNGSLDAVYAHDVFVTMDPNQILAALLAGRRVLRPGGYLVASFTTIDRPEWRRAQAEKVLAMSSRGVFGGSNPRPYVATQVDALYETAGLAVTERRYGEPERAADQPHYMVVGRASQNEPPP
jgi:SAM-dependent methyltransferase